MAFKSFVLAVSMIVALAVPAFGAEVYADMPPTGPEEVYTVTISGTTHNIVELVEKRRGDCKCKIHTGACDYWVYRTIEGYVVLSPSEHAKYKTWLKPVKDKRPYESKHPRCHAFQESCVRWGTPLGIAIGAAVNIGTYLR